MNRSSDKHGSFGNKGSGRLVSLGAWPMLSMNA